MIANQNQEFLKQNKKYKFSKQDCSHEIIEVFYKEIYNFF